MNELSLPHYGRLAWGSFSSRSKGLNVQKIVAAAIELADREGLTQVTIRNLSKQLGNAPMAIYRHIESRDELLILMFDMVLGIAPSTAPQTDAIFLWGKAIFERYKVHPWILDIPIGGMPTTPNHIAWIECALQGLASYKTISLQQKLDIALLIDGHARTIAALSRTDRPSLMDDLHVFSEWLPQVLDAAAYPLFTEVMNQNILSTDEELNFDDGLNIIIDGVKQLAAVSK